MIHWVVYASCAIVLWGVNGLFMKLGTNRASARSRVIHSALPASGPRILRHRRDRKLAWG